jgi:hypothetical protein
MQIADDVEQLGREMDPMVIANDRGLGDLEHAVQFGWDIESRVVEFFDGRVVELFDRARFEMWEQNGLEGRDTDMSKQMDGIGGQVASTARDVRADHGDEGVGV